MKFNKLNISPVLFLYFNKKKPKLEILADSGSELCKVNSTAIYWQMYVAYILFIIYNFCPFLYLEFY